VRVYLFGLALWALSSAAVFSQIVDEVPRDVAQQWLDLVDSGRYSDSWQTASPLFQKAIPEEDWIVKIQAMRKAWGPLEKRSFVRGRYLTDPPNLPKGDYFAMEFRAEFKKIKVTELVVPMKDQTGRWQVSSYSISTKTSPPQP